MKYSEFIETIIAFNQTSIKCHEPVVGVIEIKNNYDEMILIDEVIIDLILKHEGKGETDVLKIDQHIITDYKEIQPNEIIEHHFSFEPTYHTTYVGKNMTQNILVKTKVDINKSSEKELRNNAISKLKFASYFRGVFKPDFFSESVLQVERGDTNYEIKKAEGTIKPGRGVALAIMVISFIVCLIGGVILYMNMNEDINLIYIPVSIYAVIFWLTYNYKLEPYLKIGKIDFQLLNIEGNFYQANLNIEKSSRTIKEISCQLIGTEQVTYDNGSKRSTVTHHFLKSKPHIINRLLSKIEEEIPLPDRSLPKTIDNNDFKIIWQFKIMITTKRGRKLSGKAKIDLGFEKKNQIINDIKSVDFT